MSQKYHVALSDGRVMEVETDGGPPTEAMIMAHLGGKAAAAPAPPKDPGGLGTPGAPGPAIAEAAKTLGAAPGAQAPPVDPRPLAFNKYFDEAASQPTTSPLSKAAAFAQTPLAPAAHPQPVEPTGDPTLDEANADREGGKRLYNSLIRPFTDPLTVASTVATGGAGLARKAGLTALPTAFRGLQMAAQGGMGMQGLHNVYQGLSPDEEGVAPRSVLQRAAQVGGGGLQALLSAAGLKGVLGEMPTLAPAAEAKAAEGLVMPGARATAPAANPAPIPEVAPTVAPKGNVAPMPTQQPSLPGLGNFPSGWGQQPLQAEAKPLTDPWQRIFGEGAAAPNPAIRKNVMDLVDGGVSDATIRDLYPHPERGAISPRALGSLTGAATGAAGGAAADRDHPLRGAAVGALGGGIAGHFAGGAIANSTISPGVKEWLSTLALGPEGKDAKAIQVGLEGEANRTIAQITDRINKLRAPLDRSPQDAQYKFWDEREVPKGTPEVSSNPQLQPLMDEMRQIDNALKAQIQARGGLQGVDEAEREYAGRDWLNQGQHISNPIAYKLKQLSGSMSGRAGTLEPQGATFNKARSIPTRAEAMDPGYVGNAANPGPLTPSQTNPVDMFLSKAQQQLQWITRRDAEAMMDQAGLRQVGGARPPDWVPDKFSPEPETYLHPGAAQVMKQIHEAGIADNPALGFARAAAMRMTLAKLGMSAFHVGTTAYNAMGQQFGNALLHLNDGNLGGFAKEMAQVPLAPFTLPLEGRALRAQYLSGAANPVMEDLAHSGMKPVSNALSTGAIPRFQQAMAAQGGGAMGMAKAAVKNPVTAATAAFEYPTQKIMQGYVEPSKLALQAKQNALNGPQWAARNAPTGNATADTIAQWQALQRGQRSIDDIMGMMNYRNRSLPQGVKQAAQLMMTAPGWKGGTWATALGSAKDLATTPLRMAAGQPLITPRMAGAAGAVATPMALNSLYQYMHTGQGPQEAKDLIFPRTGELNPEGVPERVQGSNYLAHDIIPAIHDPLKYAASSFGALPSSIASIVRNRYWRNTQVRDPYESLPTQVGQSLKYAVKEALPISFSSLFPSLSAPARQRANPEAVGTKVEQQLGFNAAPGWTTRDPALQLAMDIAQGREAPKTPWEQERIDARMKARGAMVQGDGSAIAEGLQNGALSPRDVANLSKGLPKAADQNLRLLNAAKGLQPKEFLAVLQKANPTQRAMLAPRIPSIVNQLRPNNADDQATLQAIIKLVQQPKPLGTP